MACSDSFPGNEMESDAEQAAPVRISAFGLCQNESVQCFASSSRRRRSPRSVSDDACDCLLAAVCRSFVCKRFVKTCSGLISPIPIRSPRTKWRRSRNKTGRCLDAPHMILAGQGVRHPCWSPAIAASVFAWLAKLRRRCKLPTDARGTRDNLIRLG